MIRRPPRSTLSSSSAASDVYKRQLPNTSVVGAAEPNPGDKEEVVYVPCSSSEDAAAKAGGGCTVAPRGVLFGGAGSQLSPNCSAAAEETSTTHHVPKPISAATFLQLLPDSPMPSPARLPPIGNKRLREDGDDDNDTTTAGITPPPLPQAAASPLAHTEAHKVTVVRAPTPPPARGGVASVRDMLLKSTMSAGSRKTSTTPSGAVPKTLFTVHDLDDDTPPKGPNHTRHTPTTTVAVLDCDDVSNGSVESVPSNTAAGGGGATSLSTSTRREMDMMAALRSRTAHKASSSTSTGTTAPQQTNGDSTTPSAVNVFKALAFQRGLARNNHK
eukprot:TRINITY_DN28179_c0_g1_i1.p1 TRINITY_DN28179_c0_g1~~TRINITY_DN28179_c0_g1_i1.p1  ORF type:complete len:330 (-),score=4.82 TRINITY_DN28179_c0_g1_i1:9-998(-)